MSLQGDIVEVPKIKKAMYIEKEGCVDRISVLPTCILLYIMTFLTTKEAVQTCILSKRWKDLWKCIPTLIASNTHFQRAEFFKKFVSKVLLHRDDYSPLHNIAFKHGGYIHPQYFVKLLSYAASHNMEQFKFDAFIDGHHQKYILFFTSEFSCHSLKYLNLTLREAKRTIVLPKSLNFPQLTECHLKGVTFPSSDENGYAEPFSTCKKLNTLAIDDCALYDAQTLCVVGDKLSSLTVQFGVLNHYPFEVQISAPNLNSFAFAGRLNSSTATHKLFKHNLDYLQEARVEVLSAKITSEFAEILMSWLKRFKNVNSLVLCSETLEVLSSIPKFPDIEHVRFGNLKSLVIRNGPDKNEPKEVLEYLLQDSPISEATIVEDLPSYYDELEFIYAPDHSSIRRKNMPIRRC
ncbi:F-box-like domain superfamily [Sesbania bispinosa]|nr:F-box-like domain superfamily [Sesbania bispinosa]